MDASSLALLGRILMAKVDGRLYLQSIRLYRLRGKTQEAQGYSLQGTDRLLKDIGLFGYGWYGSRGRTMACPAPFSQFCLEYNNT